jgi:hypothetical protein
MLPFRSAASSAQIPLVECRMAINFHYAFDQAKTSDILRLGNEGYPPCSGTTFDLSLGRFSRSSASRDVSLGAIPARFCPPEI